MQCRSAAIQTAITLYNTQAQILDPLCPKISWKDIADYSFLGEFDLLWYSREDMRSSDWTKPAYCEATTKFFKLQWACEEILQLNVEIQWLYTAIHDEENAVSAAIRDLTDLEPYLALEMQRWWQECVAISAVCLHCLTQIQGFSGFLGTLKLGVRDTEECTSMDTAEGSAVTPVNSVNGR